MIRYETTVWREKTLGAATPIAVAKAEKVIGDWDEVDVVARNEYETTIRGVADVGVVFEFTFWVHDRD